jgi:hypothetical protein
MNWFDMISRFYPKYWTKSMVADAVVAEKITAEQYEQIVGDVYVV